MDFLIRLVLKYGESSCITSMHAPGKVVCNSHFLYADDILLFVVLPRLIWKQLINRLFSLYCYLSGQIGIWDKSEAFLVEEFPLTGFNLFVNRWTFLVAFFFLFFLVYLYFKVLLGVRGWGDQLGFPLGHVNFFLWLAGCV